MGNILNSGTCLTYAGNCEALVHQLRPDNAASMEATSMELDVTGLAGYDDVSVRFTHGNLSLIPNFDEEAYFSRSWFVDTEVMGCSRVSLWPATLLDLGTESGDPGSWYFDGVSVSVAAAFVNATNSLQVTFDARCRSNIFTTVRHVLDGAAGATPGLAAFAVAGACGLLSMVPGLGRGAGRQCFNLSWMSVLLMALMAVFVVSQSTLGKLCSCNSAEIEIVFYHDPSVLVNGATAGATVVSGDSLLLECTNDQGSSVPCYFQPNSSQCFFSDRSIYGNCGSGRPFGTNDGSVVEAEVSWREALLHYSTGTVLADDNAALDWAPDFPGMLLDWSDACMSMQTDMSDATSGQLTPLIPHDLTSTFSVGRWLEQGQAEHASVAAFNRASLSLMAVGAPARIIRDTQIAAVEEVRHAELSFSLAALCNHATNASSTNDDVTGSLLRREKHGLSVQVPEVHDMAIPQPLEFDTDVIDVLRSTFHEGCIAELRAAALAAVELEDLRQWSASNDCRCVSSEDQDAVSGYFASPQCIVADAACEVVAMVVSEEAGHAVLAWRTVRWLLTQMDDDAMTSALQELVGQYFKSVASGTGLAATQQAKAVEVAVAARLVPMFWSYVTDLDEGVLLPQIPSELLTMGENITNETSSTGVEKLRRNIADILDTV